MRHRARLSATVSIGCLLIGSPACGPPLEVRYERDLAAAPEPAKHAIQSNRLRSAMRRLDQLAAERLPKEMDVAADRARRTQAVAAAARELAKASEAIPEAVVGVEMSESAHGDFLRLAGKLHERSTVLAADAPNLPAEELRDRLHDIDSVCAECHSRYRILPRVP